MSNNRIYWAIEGVSIAPHQTVDFTGDKIVKGLQSIGITTSFNLEQVFEIGQLSIYENIEDLPDITVTMEKVLDGAPLIYHLTTSGYTANTLAGRSNQRCNVLMNIYGDTQDAASGVPQTEVLMSGMYVSSASYTFPVDGNFTESITLVGNNKEWRDGSSKTFLLQSDMFDGTDSPPSGVQRRQDLVFGSDTYANKTVTILPSEIEGISSSGTNDLVNSVYSAHVQNLTVSTDLGREGLNELGRRGPYFRYVNYPVEVTSEIEVTSSQGDQVDAVEDSEANLTNQTIFIVVADSTKIDLGTKNKLSNVSYGGADATGGNATVTYSYTTFNDFVVTQANDPG